MHICVKFYTPAHFKLTQTISHLIIFDIYSIHNTNYLHWSEASLGGWSSETTSLNIAWIGKCSQCNSVMPWTDATAAWWDTGTWSTPLATWIEDVQMYETLYEVCCWRHCSCLSPLNASLPLPFLLTLLSHLYSFAFWPVTALAHSLTSRFSVEMCWCLVVSYYHY